MRSVAITNTVDHISSVPLIFTVGGCLHLIGWRSLSGVTCLPEVQSQESTESRFELKVSDSRARAD